MVSATVDFTTKVQDIPPDAVSSCISTYGHHIVSTPAQVTSLAALKAGGYRIPLQWNNGNPVSSAGGGPHDNGIGDEFIAAILALGAIPHIVIGGTSDNNFSPTDAANMVRHFSPKGVKHYIVGNEPNNGGMPISTYAALFNSCSQAMKSVDPTISVAGPAWAYFDAGTLQAFINSCRGHFDAVDYHHYAMGNPPAMNTETALSKTGDWGNEVAAIRKMLDAAGLQQVSIQVGEYNWAWQYADGENDGDGGDHRFYQAPITAWAASLIGHVLTAGGKAFQYSDQNGPLGLTVEGGNKDQGKPSNSPQPIYWGLAAWTQGNGPGKELFSAHTDSPAVEVYATDTKVILVNKTDTVQPVTVSATGSYLLGQIHVTDPTNAYAGWVNGAPGSLQPFQVAVIETHIVVVTPPAPKPTPTPTPTPTPAPVSAVVTVNTFIGAGAPPSWAMLVQRLLVKVGYTNQQINGSYGITTTANVKDYQTKNNLPATGVVDAATLAKLIG